MNPIILIKRFFISVFCLLVLISCGGGNSSGITASTSTTKDSLTGTLGPNTTPPAWVTTAYANVLKTITTPVAPLYTADSLAAALANNNFFASNQTTTQQVYNVAAFLANAAHETGSFQYLTELGNYSVGQPNNWSTDGLGKFSGSLSGCQNSYGVLQTSNCFYGRGALQLSHNGTSGANYDVYAQYSGGGIAVGVNTSPDLIISKNLAFDSGAWFWSPLSCALWSCSDVNHPRPMDGFIADPSTYEANDPFGRAIAIINGPDECITSSFNPQGTNPRSNPAESTDRINRFLAYLPIVATAAGISISKYNTAATVGVSCTTGGGPAPTPAGAISVNLVNASSSSVAFTLGTPAPFYDFPAIDANKNQVWTNTSSSNIAGLFPNGNVVTMSVYLNRNGAGSPPVACSAQMAATGSSYTITANGDGTCAITSAAKVLRTLRNVR